MSSAVKKIQIVCFLWLLVIAGSVIAISIGAVRVPLSSWWGGLSGAQEAVLLSIRLPRILLAILVGAALATSGAAMQGLFRNPLADPGLIGIASGAALSVACVIVLGRAMMPFFGLYGLSFAAFIGSLCTSLVMLRLAKFAGTFSVGYMLLAGIAINALSGAGTGFLSYISDDQQLRTLVFWTMGNLGGALWPSVVVAASIIIPSIVILIKYARALNILLLGDEEARYLGVDSERLKYIIISATALSVGAAVAVSGIIGFVGLVVPHLVRLLLGPDHRFLLPSAALLGALLLLVADTIARTIVAPAEMPVGILTSLIGGPFFLWLLIKQYKLRLPL